MMDIFIFTFSRIGEVFSLPAYDGPVLTLNIHLYKRTTVA